MPSDVTLARVKRVVRDSLKIGPEFPMNDQMPLIGGEHDLDSLDALLVVTSIEKEFKIRIPDRTVGREVFSNIHSLADFVESQQHQDAGRGHEA
jgi:acyl carrier protein